jgi:hypothetical protein
LDASDRGRRPQRAAAAALMGDIPNLGRPAACRRVVRTIYLGSAPTGTEPIAGLKVVASGLAALWPEETPAVFDDALRHSTAATIGTRRSRYQDWQMIAPSSSCHVTALRHLRSRLSSADQSILNKHHLVCYPLSDQGGVRDG